MQHTIFGFGELTLQVTLWVAPPREREAGREAQLESS